MKPVQTIEIALYLHFRPGYKGDFNLCDFTDNNVGGCVPELFVFDQFEYSFIALNFSNPTDILAVFGLPGDVSLYIFAEGYLDRCVTVDSFRINIRVRISDEPTRNHEESTSVRKGDGIDKRLSAIRSGNCQIETD